MTNEHIVPTWAHTVLDSDPRELIDADRHIFYGKQGGEERRREWDAPGVQFTAKCVCESCNSGWMSTIETDAMPFLEPMIRGQDISLLPYGPTAIARWLGLKAIIERYAQSPIIPVDGDIRRQFHEHRTPPLHWCIFIGRYIGSYPVRISTDVNEQSRSLGSLMPIRNYRMLVTIAIGYFVGQVFAPERPVAIAIQRSNFFIQVWPPPPPGVIDGMPHWPPSGILTDAHLEAIDQMKDGVPR